MLLISGENCNVNIDGGTKGDFYFLLYNYLFLFQNVL